MLMNHYETHSATVQIQISAGNPRSLIEFALPFYLFRLTQSDFLTLQAEPLCPSSSNGLKGYFAFISRFIAVFRSCRRGRSNGVLAGRGSSELKTSRPDQRAYQLPQWQCRYLICCSGDLKPMEALDHEHLKHSSECSAVILLNTYLDKDLKFF